MNTIHNQWSYRAKGRTRHVTIEIETTRPAGAREFELMARLAAIVEAELAAPATEPDR